MMTWKALGIGGWVVLAVCHVAACSSEDSIGGSGGSDATASSSVASSTSSTGVTSATGSTSGTMASSSSASGTGGGPPMCMAAYSNIPIGECDLLQQNCMPGFSCRPQQMGGNYTTTCVAQSGVKPQGTACAVTDECEAGLFCASNKCSPVCCNDPGSTGCAGGTCNLDLTYPMTNYFVRVCSFLTSCMLFTPNSCPPGEECHLFDPAQGLAECALPGPNQVNEGDPCNYVNDCHETQLCFTQMGTKVCRYNCDLTNWQTLQPGLGGCPAGHTCQDWGFMAPFGVCLP